MKVTVYELRVKAYLYQDIAAEDCQYKISKFIDTALAEDEELRRFHNENKFKNYVFGGFWPFEKDEVYKGDKVYSFQLRTVDEELAQAFNSRLEFFHNGDMNGVSVEMRILSKKGIDRLYCLTPIILKEYGDTDGQRGYWKEFTTIDHFDRRIKENLIKKYNAFTGEKIDEDFDLFSAIEFKNYKPIAFKYKGVKLLGDKADLSISPDKTAQKLAYFALGTGVGEMNARGAGFVNFKAL